MKNFSWERFLAIFVKEFIQMRRDRLTFAMIVGIPILQLILFGYAINMDPKNLPVAVVLGDYSTFSRTFMYGMQNSGYFKITHTPSTLQEANDLMATGQAQFILEIPENFYRKLMRGEKPAILLAADATDPTTTSNAIASLQELSRSFTKHESSPPFELRIHKRYNPEGRSRYHIVPGLIGVILTMTMMMMTALSMTRERERGTMEGLLATPARPIEVMAGKISPFIIVGYIQLVIVLLAARLLFEVPFVGSLTLLSLVLIIFITANLSLGFTFSTLAKNQLQAMQMSFFFFLPSIILSGFMFPFRSMPTWAQYLGEILPLTHFLRIVRGILLKGSGMIEILPELWPLLLFWVFMLVIALKRYQETLD